jgi:predicted nucleotidyltransferase
MTEIQSLENIDLKRVLVQPLKAAFSPERIVLFGSHVWGTPDTESDVDVYVLVRSSNATPLERAVQAHKAVGMVPFAKDIIVQTTSEFERLSNIQGTLQHRIANEGRIIYEFTND